MSEQEPRRNSRQRNSRQQTGDYNRSTSAKPSEGTKKKIIYRCWKCQRDFDSETPLPRDATRCPYCGMVHGYITTDTFTHGYDSDTSRSRGQARS